MATTPKLTIALEIKTTIERDGGYYGIQDSLEETVRLIKRDMDKYRLFVGEGTASAIEVPATITLVGLTVTDIDSITKKEDASGV